MYRAGIAARVKLSALRVRDGGGRLVPPHTRRDTWHNVRKQTTIGRSTATHQQQRKETP